MSYCPISFKEFAFLRPEEIETLPCGHRFEKAALEKWLDEKEGGPACPYCSRALPDTRSCSQKCRDRAQSVIAALAMVVVIIVWCLIWIDTISTGVSMLAAVIAWIREPAVIDSSRAATCSEAASYIRLHVGDALTGRLLRDPHYARLDCHSSNDIMGSFSKVSGKCCPHEQFLWDEFDLAWEYSIGNDCVCTPMLPCEIFPGFYDGHSLSLSSDASMNRTLVMRRLRADCPGFGPHRKNVRVIEVALSSEGPEAVIWSRSPAEVEVVPPIWVYK